LEKAFSYVGKMTICAKIAHVPDYDPVIISKNVLQLGRDMSCGNLVGRIRNPCGGLRNTRCMPGWLIKHPDRMPTTVMKLSVPKILYLICIFNFQKNKIPFGDAMKFNDLKEGHQYSTYAGRVTFEKIEGENKMFKYFIQNEARLIWVTKSDLEA